MASYRDLLAWQRAMDFTVEVYRLTARFPSQEVYGLRAQLQRAAVSVPSNIAEGHDRRSVNEYAHFLLIARGSLAEAETQLALAVRLGYVEEQDIQRVWELGQESGRLILGIHRSLTGAR